MSAGRADLVLEPSCTLRDAVELQFHLLTTDCSRPEVTIDASRVEHIDTAGLQLLVAFARIQQQAGRALHWQACSDSLLQGSRTLGLDQALGLPVARARSSP